MNKYEVIKAKLTIDLNEDKWADTILSLLEKCEMWEDSIDELAMNLTAEEHKFIYDSMNIDKAFYDIHKVFCLYWFIKKLMIYNLDSMDYCDTVMEYLDCLAKLVKSYIFYL